MSNASGIADLNTAEVLLRIHDLTLQYQHEGQTITAAEGISFELGAEDRLVLLGPSGCGKSSLLRATGGFMKPSAGSVTLRGNAVVGPGTDRIMVFQEFDQLLPWKTVRGNVIFPMRVSRRFCTAEIRDRADEMIGKVGLRRFSDAFPHMLSGGMKMRVAIARALAMQPAILLMDEPFAALDAITRRSLQEELLRIWHGAPFAMLFVTHSIEEAILLGARVLILSARPGRIRAEVNVKDLEYEDIGAPKFVARAERIACMLSDNRQGQDGCSN